MFDGTPCLLPTFQCIDNFNFLSLPPHIKNNLCLLKLLTDYFTMCDPENTDFLPNKNVKEIKYNTENNQEKESKLPCWRKIPCIGIALIIVKNLVNGASDVIVKKITDIGKYKLIFYTY